MPRFRNTAENKTAMPNTDQCIADYDNQLLHDLHKPHVKKEDSLREFHTVIQQPTPNSTPATSPTSTTVSLPHPSNLNGSSNSHSSPTFLQNKRNHSGRASARGPNYIPRPKNAFILYRSHILKSGKVRTVQQNVASIEIGNMWKVASSEERSRFEELAKQEKKRHSEKYPEYKFVPKKTDETPVTPPRRVCKSVERRSRKIGDETNTTTGRASEVSKPYSVSTPSRPKKSMPTPEPTPERLLRSPSLATSPPTSPLSFTRSEPMEESSDDGGACNSLFRGMFDSLQKYDFEDLNDTPSFSKVKEDERFRVDFMSVPCLASSAYYNPTFEYGSRARSMSDSLSLPSMIEGNEPYMRAIKPTIPFWNAEADWNYWDDSLVTPDMAITMDNSSHDSPGSHLGAEFSATNF